MNEAATATVGRESDPPGTTHWSAVFAAGQAESPQAAAALDELCRTYWYPLYAYVRRRGHPVEEAQDLTQEFFARLIEKRWLAVVDPGKGRFRTFLLTALNHFLAKEWRRSQAAKRGGHQLLVSLDDTAETRYVQEPASDTTPEKLYERRWALGVFDSALNRLRSQYAAADKSRMFDVLKKFLTVEPAEGEYTRLGEALAMSSGAISVAVHRLRQHYRAMVREEVARTVDSPAELEAELRWLLTVLS